MAWHWGVFFILLIMTFIEQFGHISRKNCERFCAFMSIVFIFISSIRWNQTIGDWEGYYSVYCWFEPNEFLDIFCIDYWPFEPLYYLATRFIRFFLNDYVYVQVFMALVTIGCFYQSAKYINRKIEIYGKEFGIERSIIIASFLMWWATSCASIYTVRTNAAAAICLYSIRFIERKDLKKFLFTILVALGFHFTSLIFIPAYYLYNKKMSIKTFLMAIIGVIFIEIVGLNRIISLVGLLGGRYARKVATYNVQLGTTNLSYMNYTTWFLIIKALSNTILVVAVGFLIIKYMKKNERIKGINNLYLMGAFIQALTINYNFNFARVAVLYINQQFFILPHLFNLPKNKNATRIIFFTAFVFYTTLKMYSLLNSQEGYHVFTTVFSR